MSNIHPTDDANIFRVESDTDAERIYIVDTTNMPWTCTCTGYATKRNKNISLKNGLPGHCKHIEYIQRYVNNDARQRDRLKKREDEAAAAEFERIKTVSSLKSIMKGLRPE